MPCQSATSRICCRQQVAPLGHDDGRFHLHAELERDGELGGIGDDDRGAFDVFEHAAAAGLALQAADADLYRGIAFGLFELVAQILRLILSSFSWRQRSRK